MALSTEVSLMEALAELPEAEAEAVIADLDDRQMLYNWSSSVNCV